MKFTAGYWEIRPGVTPTYPVQVHEVEVDGAGMTVYAATKALNHRGDTLNLPLLTVRYTSPMRDIIRVQVSHHKGGLKRGPDFELNPEPVQVEVSDEARAGRTDQRAAVRAGGEESLEGGVLRRRAHR